MHRAIGGLAALLMASGSAYGQGRPTPAGISVVRPNPVGAYLAPGGGIPAQQVEGVYHHWNWMMMLNAGMIDTGADYILFKNGDVWRHPQLPPQDIDVAKAKQLSAGDWGSWQRTGSVVVIRMAGGHEERYGPTQLVRYEAAPKNQRVEGRWDTTLSQVSKTGGQSVSALVNSALVLHRDGGFEWEGFSGMSFQIGTASTRTGGTFTNSRPAHGGHYVIDGYTLELQFDDGRVERYLFYWAGGAAAKRYEMALVNGRRYMGGLKR